MSFDDVRGNLREDAAAATPPVSPALRAGSPECARVSEEQDPLQASFDLVREGTPAVPPSLDQKVLARYREHIRSLAEPQVRKPTATARRLARWTLAWTAAAAFALAIACWEAWFTRAPEAPRAAAPVPAASQPSTRVSASRTQAAESKPRAQTTRARPLAARQDEGRPARTARDGVVLPTGFRGLMYCDELSCAGSMDVIRVELPAAAWGIPLKASPGNAAVEADVLVGPDGVARAIRVVE